LSKRWKDQERKFAELLGGKRKLFGGTHDTKCIDVETDDLIVDVKSTHGKKSISIKREDLEDIREMGIKIGKLGILGFQFYYDKNQYIIIHIDDFQKLVKSKS